MEYCVSEHEDGTIDNSIYDGTQRHSQWLTQRA